MKIKEKTYPQTFTDRYLLPLLPGIAVGLALFRDDIAPWFMAVCLCSALILYIAHVIYKRKNARFDNVFEISDNRVIWSFNQVQPSVSVDLDKIDTIKYGKGFMWFGGRYPYAREVFFPERHRTTVLRVVAHLRQKYPDITFAKI
ncbi:hypothetical protein [Spongorhabdus nitratireducens]